ncbi:elongation factor P 5-aminopentanone reductase [Virgibacillus alimentarius]|uniref:3-oxoacyl-[acyl-carrier protein] reductase n=1 Tax=Virgibacillus alimentarius TaxID=698769 RepID=A0ABS4S447_9BACI|nr:MULTISPECIES: SDR family oxidoreductase [Virgibacillus]MBP2256253.1 3-oxoacyl-[acyl-carrier protein] reductase [Virgibacillus alimentarius]HLR66200.1 SDR family oxidoreductase [Virgibacillus sp.]
MGKNVLIIGASGDIGIAIADRLAMDGYQLLLHYNKNREKIDEFINKLDHNCVLTTMQADLFNNEEIKNLLIQIVYPVDYIIFASGAAFYGLFQDTSEKAMDEMLTLHVKAPWMIARHLLPAMIQKRAGKIILITSIWGSVGASFEVIYSAVKGAQNSFVKALAKEVAPCGISVNAVSPGFIDTKMNHNLSKEEKKMVLSEIPMNRAGTPSEIAHTISFLLDENANYIQGEIIGMTGGW